MSTVFNSLQINSNVRGNGIQPRLSVVAATTAPIALQSDLSGAVVDGVTLAADDRLLVKNQSEVVQIQAVQAIANTVDSLAGLYFNINSPGGGVGLPATNYYVWYKSGSGTIGTDPGLTNYLLFGFTGIQVNIATGATATAVASATASALAALATVFSANNVVDVINITNVSAGYAVAVADGNTGFTSFSTSQYGSGAVDHGIWVVQSGAAASYRADDLIAGDSVEFVYLDCEQGTLNVRTSWRQVNHPCVVDTYQQLWVESALFKYNANDLFYANSATTLAAISTTNNGSLITNSSGVPSWAAASANQMLVSDGSNNVSWSSTLPTGTTVNGPFTSGNQVVNKSYVDSTSAGLDPKQAVRVRTLGTPAVHPTISTGANNIGGTYNPTGGTGGTGAFTGVDLTNVATFDLGGITGGALLVNDRVLIMNQSDAKQNGIYVVTIAGASGAIERSADQNGTPPANVAGGNFTFVEAGSNFQGTGWVLLGDGVLTLNTDPLSWVQFSTAGQWNALDGITISGANISTSLYTNGGVVYNGATPNGQLQVDLGATSITGVVTTSHGGTGQNLTISNQDLLVGNGSGQLDNLASVARKVLTTDSSGVVDWRNSTYINTVLAQDDSTTLTFTSAGALSVNNLQVSNATTGLNPSLASVGTDSNIGLSLIAKGSGAVNVLPTTGSATSGEIRLFNTAGTQYVGIKAPTLSASTTWEWPVADGSAGYVMTTDGSGNLSFANVSSVQKFIVPLAFQQINANSSSFDTVAYFDWNSTEYGGTLARKIYYEADVSGGKTLTIQVLNVTTSTVIGTQNQTAPGFYNFSFTEPVANARLAIQVKKNAPGGANPAIYGITMVLNP